MLSSSSAIVKLFVSSVAFSTTHPWQTRSLNECTGSGFVMDGRRILTNAHVVADQRLVLVRKHGSARRYAARVLAVGHDCDLALLTVDDNEDDNDNDFFTGMTPLQLTAAEELPRLDDHVSVVGYPKGGDKLSVTRGVVSRIEMQTYSQCDTCLLAIQIDAAINSGNSGGPVMSSDGRVVGMAFEHLCNSDSIGYIIPSTVIHHFLADVSSTTSSTLSRSVCSLGITVQPMHHDSFRRRFGMTAAMSGVYVTAVDGGGAADGILKVGDIVLSIDSMPIDNTGEVVFRDEERIGFEYVVTRKHRGDSIEVEILRDSVVILVSVVLQPPSPLVPFLYDTPPDYVVYAGLVFVPMTMQYLHEFSRHHWRDEAPRRLVHETLNCSKTKGGREQVVVLATVLPDAINMGYEDVSDCMLCRVNGIDVRDLAHVRTLLSQVNEPFVLFELEDRRVVVVDHAEERRSQARIAQHYRVPLSSSEPG